ncbi:MAG: hypothetical protein CO113_14740, partial [Elusimicrobia bacterium CG_4_9_14_3_um_filter_62_55]
FGYASDETFPKDSLSFPTQITDPAAVPRAVAADARARTALHEALHQRPLPEPQLTLSALEPGKQA